MKRYIVVIGFALTLAGLPLLSWGGSYTPGTVTVSGNSMNVPLTFVSTLLPAPMVTSC